MNKFCKEDYAGLAGMIKAMAHPTRLFIIDELSHGERCVCELQEMIGADISTVSKHLSLLKDALLVEDEKRGTKAIYSLRAPCILKFLGCMETLVLEGQQEQQKCKI